jgi:hypothetical protein
VDELTLNNPEQPLNELVEASANVLNGLAFKQEQRIAAIVGSGRELLRQHRRHRGGGSLGRWR